MKVKVVKQREFTPFKLELFFEDREDAESLYQLMLKGASEYNDVEHGMTPLYLHEFIGLCISGSWNVAKSMCKKEVWEVTEL